jgi:hypothetical protein
MAGSSWCCRRSDGLAGAAGAAPDASTMHYLTVMDRKVVSLEQDCQTLSAHVEGADSLEVT